MTEPMDIVHRLATDLMEGSPLASKRILVTAGPTWRPSIRYAASATAPAAAWVSPSPRPAARVPGWNW